MIFSGSYLKKEKSMNLGVPELVIIFLIILVVFGAGKIPSIARDMGKGIREFKRAMSSDESEAEAVKAQPEVKAVRKKTAKKS
jgi:sec-independent protein translocase protein TatA